MTDEKDTTEQDEEMARAGMQKIWERPKAEEDAEFGRLLGKETPALRIGRQSSKIFIETRSPRLIVTAAQAREIATALVGYAVEVELRNR